MQEVRWFCSQSIRAGLDEQVTYLDQSPGSVLGVESKPRRMRGVLRRSVMAAPGMMNLSWRRVWLESGLAMIVVVGETG